MFECKRCGRCCIYSIPQFDKEEYERVAYIAEQIGIDFVEVPIDGIDTYFTSKTFERFVEFMEKLKENPELGEKEPALTCEFLKFENGVSHCLIYDLRPTVCREFGHGKNKLLQCIHPDNVMLK